MISMITTIGIVIYYMLGALMLLCNPFAEQGRTSTAMHNGRPTMHRCKRKCAKSGKKRPTFNDKISGNSYPPPTKESYTHNLEQATRHTTTTTIHYGYCTRETPHKVHLLRCHFAANWSRIIS